MCVGSEVTPFSSTGSGQRAGRRQTSAVPVMIPTPPEQAAFRRSRRPTPTHTRAAVATWSCRHDVQRQGRRPSRLDCGERDDSRRRAFARAIPSCSRPSGGARKRTDRPQANRGRQESSSTFTSGRTRRSAARTADRLRCRTGDSTRRAGDHCSALARRSRSRRGEIQRLRRHGPQTRPAHREGPDTGAWSSRRPRAPSSNAAAARFTPRVQPAPARPA